METEVHSRPEKESAREYALRYLLESIVTLKYAPGEQLFETELKQQLGLSRTPIREALLELVGRRLVVIYPQRGIFVSKLDYNVISEIVHLRSIVETDITREAALRAKPEDCDELAEIIALQECYARRNPTKFTKLDNEFHKKMYYMCDAQFTYECIDRMMPLIDRHRFMAQQLNYNLERTVKTHKELLHVLEIHDAEAAAKIEWAHVQVTLEDLEIIREKYPEAFTDSEE